MKYMDLGNVVSYLPVCREEMGTFVLGQPV